MGDLDGRVALVTGGGSGIGRASCVALARAGAAVMVADLDLTAAEGTVATIDDAGGRAPARSASTCPTRPSARRWWRRRVEAFGALHVLHANAGIAGLDVDGPTASLAPEMWDRLIAVNLSGVFYSCHFASAGHGRGRRRLDHHHRVVDGDRAARASSTPTRPRRAASPCSPGRCARAPAPWECGSTRSAPATSTRR